MRTAIIGAGIVGVTTAYELALAGHEVSVFEQRGSVAAEGSFAGGGLLAASSLAPGIGHAMPGQALRRFFGAQPALRLGGVSALTQLPWLWRSWRAHQPGPARVSSQALHRLAQFSRLRLMELTKTLHLDFEQAAGHLVLLRSEAELKATEPGLALLREWAVAHEVADAARCRELEPGLNEAAALQAGLYFPQDGAGNCRQFAHLMKIEAQRLGASFRFDAPVQQLTPGAPAMLEVVGCAPAPFDAVVVCAASAAASLLSPLGVKLPLLPVYGYSLTAPLRHLDGLDVPGPRAALSDGRHGVTITRLGQRVRVAGIAELCGQADRLSLAPLRLLHRVLDGWFPGAAVTQTAQHWKGVRPMLPDGPPVLGASGASGIWLNLGHGNHGWTLACGSARVIADTLAGREAPLDPSHLTLARLHRP